MTSLLEYHSYYRSMSDLPISQPLEQLQDLCEAALCQAAINTQADLYLNATFGGTKSEPIIIDSDEFFADYAIGVIKDHVSVSGPFPTSKPKQRRDILEDLDENPAPVKKSRVKKPMLKNLANPGSPLIFTPSQVRKQTWKPLPRQYIAFTTTVDGVNYIAHYPYQPFAIDAKLLAQHVRLDDNDAQIEITPWQPDQCLDCIDLDTCIHHNYI